MKTKLGLILSTALLAMALPTNAQPPAASAQAQGENAKVSALADAIEQDSLASNFSAQFREGKRISGFVDYSLDDLARDAAKRERWKAQLAAIRADALGEVERETYDILRFTLIETPMDENEYWLTFDLTPYQAPMAIGFVQQVLAAHPLATPADAADYVRLAGAYATMLETLAAKVAAQTARGIYLPRAALPPIRATWTTLAASADALQPAPARLSALDAASRASLETGVRAASDGRVKPAFARIQALLGPAYEAKAPEAVGLAQYPGGKDLYRKLIHRYTTLKLTPEEIQKRGLERVADVAGRMQAIRAQLGFTGTSRAFYDRISTDPRSLAKTPADVEATYMRYIRAIEPKVSSYFRTQPRAPYGVKRLPPAAEPGQTFGYYSPPNATEPRGYYNYNGSNLDKRSLINAGTLIYHELIPGHHFQIAGQSENEALSPFRKNYMAAAFTEGWGEYAASLGIELGLYDTPEALYGRYINEMFLTVRLVVDSGMNYHGWSLEKARAYMREVTSLSELEIDSESLRYSVSLPGQALAYRTGYDALWDLRHRAEKTLGKRFDIRDFHAAVLGSGARPLPLVEASVDRMIAAKKGN